MTRNLLVLGAGRGQIGLIRAGQRLGYHVSVASMSQSNPPGISVADDWIDVDIADPESVLEACQGRSFDGVATACMDTALRSLGALADATGVQGLSYEAAKACSDKITMKGLFERAGVLTARSCVIDLDGDADPEVFQALHLPLVVKAPHLQGSAGIFICQTLEDVHGALHELRSQGGARCVIVEEFVAGVEFGAQAIVVDGVVLDVQCHGDETVLRHTAVPVAHFLPSSLPQEIEARAREQVVTAIQALGLDNCVVNADLIASGDDVYVIEITGRAGANCLPELMSAYYGFDYYELVARIAMNDDPMSLWESRSVHDGALYAGMLYSQTQRGTVSALSMSASADVLHAQLFIQLGSHIQPFETSHDCIGEVLVQGDSLAQCRDTLKAFENGLVLDVR